MLSATHFLDDAVVGALVCDSPTTLGFGSRIALPKINITMLQLTKYLRSRESRFHGQTRQLHGRMRHFESCRRFYTPVGMLVRSRTIVVLELSREVAGVLVAETDRRFLDGAAVAQELDGPLQSQPPQPAPRRLAEDGPEETF